MKPTLQPSPKFTRRHYVLTAAKIAALPAEYRQGSFDVWRAEFAADNERFDAARFAAACKLPTK